MSSLILHMSHILPCIFNIGCFLKDNDPVNLHFDQNISVSRIHCPYILSFLQSWSQILGPLSLYNDCHSLLGTFHFLQEVQIPESNYYTS
jgi:hypothetical protein